MRRGRAVLTCSFLLTCLLTFDLRDFDYSRDLVSPFSLTLQFKTLPSSIVPIKRQVENFIMILKMSQYSFMGLLRRSRIVFDLWYLIFHAFSCGLDLVDIY